MAAKKTGPRFEILDVSDSEPENSSGSLTTELTVPAKQFQLALTMFEELSDSESIQSATQEIIFAKSKQLIDVADLNLLARKSLNVCHFLAAGIEDQELYEFDLRFFRWMLNYTNRNIGNLRAALREAQKGAAQVLQTNPNNPTEELWASIPLIGATGIGNGKVRFRLDPGLRKELKNPTTKSIISMRVQALFTSVHALNLYELMCDQPRPSITDWITLDAFREAMHLPLTSSTSIYKVLKRDVIDIALDQINKFSDLFIDYDVDSKGKGKAFTHIRFHLKNNSSYVISDAFDSGRENLKRLYEILTNEFGLSDRDLDFVMERMSEPMGKQKVEEAIEFTRYRTLTGYARFPSKLLKTAITDGMRLSESERKDLAAKTNKSSSQGQVLELGLKQGAEQVVIAADKLTELLDGVSQDQADEYWRAFAKTPSAAISLKNVEDKENRESACENQTVRAAFAIYIDKINKPSGRTRKL